MRAPADPCRTGKPGDINIPRRSQRACKSLRFWHVSVASRPPILLPDGALAFFLRIFSRCALDRLKIWLAVTMMISGHPFIPYAAEVVAKIEQEAKRPGAVPELMAAQVAD